MTDAALDVGAYTKATVSRQSQRRWLPPQATVEVMPLTTARCHTHPLARIAEALNGFRRVPCEFTRRPPETAYTVNAVSSFPTSLCRSTSGPFWRLVVQAGKATQMILRQGHRQPLASPSLPLSETTRAEALRGRKVFQTYIEDLSLRNPEIRDWIRSLK